MHGIQSGTETIFFENGVILPVNDKIIGLLGVDTWANNVLDTVLYWHNVYLCHIVNICKSMEIKCLIRE